MWLLRVATLLCVCSLALGNSRPSCRTPTAVADINWKKLNDKKLTWYENYNLGNKSKTTPFDCMDWKQFTAVGNGVVVTTNVWMKSNNRINKLTTHFVRVEGRPGIYKKNNSLKQQHLDVVSSAIVNEGAEARDQLREVNKISHEYEFFFITDYQSYFMMAGCLPDKGWRAFAKTPAVDGFGGYYLRARTAAMHLAVQGSWSTSAICNARTASDLKPA